MDDGQQYNQGNKDLLKKVIGKSKAVTLVSVTMSFVSFMQGDCGTGVQAPVFCSREQCVLVTQ